MNRKLKPFSLACGIAVTATSCIMRVVTGYLERKAGGLPADQRAQAAPGPAAAKARVRFIIEAPPTDKPYRPTFTR